MKAAQHWNKSYELVWMHRYICTSRSGCMFSNSNTRDAETETRQEKQHKLSPRAYVSNVQRTNKEEISILGSSNFLRFLERRGLAANQQL